MTSETQTANGPIWYPHPWITPPPVTFEMETLAQNLITGKGLLYTESLLMMMDEIEGQPSD